MPGEESRFLCQVHTQRAAAEARSMGPNRERARGAYSMGGAVHAGRGARSRPQKGPRLEPVECGSHGGS